MNTIGKRQESAFIVDKEGMRIAKEKPISIMESKDVSVNAKKCKGSQILIEHYFLANPNASPSQKMAEHLGYCPLCWFYIPGKSYSYSKPGFKSKKGISGSTPEKDSL